MENTTNNNTIKILSTMVTAVGIDLLIILKKKYFFTRFSFGSNANIKMEFQWLKH